MFRIQKLLLYEFEEIYEPVLIENPFTLVDDSGVGMRQYYIALTATKLLFGCDSFNELTQSFYKHCEVDPAIETFQMVSMIPLKFVKLNFFRKNNRELMRITVIGVHEKPLLFEFGGHIFRSLFWNTWRERVSTLRVKNPSLCHITNSSPFSSTDVILDEEVHRAIVHQCQSAPNPSYKWCFSSSGSIN